MPLPHDRAFREGRLVMDSKQDLVAEIDRLKEMMEDARHYASVCPVPAELTGPARFEMLERRQRILKSE